MFGFALPGLLSQFPRRALKWLELLNLCFYAFTNIGHLLKKMYFRKVAISFLKLKNTTLETQAKDLLYSQTLLFKSTCKT